MRAKVEAFRFYVFSLLLVFVDSLGFPYFRTCSGVLNTVIRQYPKSHKARARAWKVLLKCTEVVLELARASIGSASEVECGPD